MNDERPLPRRTVNPFFRLIVAVFGLTFLGLGVVMILVGLAVIVIAVGLVEWWAGLRR